MTVRMPEDDVAPSYVGTTKLAVCQHCEFVAYVPVWDIGLPHEGFCTNCERIVVWDA